MATTGKGGLMVGRKRKQNIKRQPNGQPARERGIDPKAIAQLMPHRRLVPADVAHDPKAESIMGRLCLNGWITEIQYQAGVKYRSAVMLYRAAINAPRGEVSMSGVIVGPWGGRGLTEERAVEIRDKYMAAYEAVEEVGGGRHVSWLILDKPGFVLPRAICGLNALAIHYGLTSAKKPATAINAR